ncbi:PGF-CTERM sorting domain-containing protein, partial [Haloferax profundi]|uniref:PGF-CTERM sorting domain-containing protein n=1 Tax=Haloferax profundi TaxID=1544718 RepID=UPI000A64AA11
LASNEIETGESVEVTATILNDGDVTTNRTVNLTKDGSVIDTKEVTNLDPGNETTVAFLPTFNQAGTYNLSVGSQAVSLTVVEPTTTSEPVTTTATPEETETQAPGFGIPVALVALLALVGLARRRTE